MPAKRKRHASDEWFLQSRCPRFFHRRTRTSRPPDARLRPGGAVRRGLGTLRRNALHDGDRRRPLPEGRQPRSQHAGLGGPRPHRLVGRTQGPRAVSRAGIRRLLPAGRRGHAAQAVLAIPGASAPAEAARRRGVERIAGTGPEHRRRHGAGGQDGRQEAHRVLHHGRRRAAGRQHLGSGDGRLALQARQPGGHHRPQPPADRRLGEGRDERRAAGGSLSQLRLGGHRGRRPRHPRGRRGIAEGEEHSGGRQADLAAGQHGQGQGRQLHGKRCRLARPRSDL